MYPNIRMRRLRNDPLVRAMVTEVNLSPSNLILPLFVRECLEGNTKEPVVSMPGVYQHSIGSLLDECGQVIDLGIPGIILFGIPENKDGLGSEAYNPDGIIPRAINAIKRKYGKDLLVTCDVCLCEYTDHGHCAPLVDDKICNDTGIELYAKAALEYARAGADIVAPSDMMDGRVARMRKTLDKEGFTDVLIMSYAVKYASSFYGPFRDAAGSGEFLAGPSDRKSHQMDPGNLTQAFREVEMDIKEGADIILVKPALPYLDIIGAISDRYHVPIAAYHVSGEYSMLKAAAQKEWLNEKTAVIEVLTAMRRAGANIIITYYAKDVAEGLR
jgi:porphobilinogen synthase